MGNLFGDCLGTNTYKSYSCIPKIENYNDLSYQNLKNQIDNSIITILKYNEANNFPLDRNISGEYNLLEKYIDCDDNHFNELEEGYNELCRYSDIKTYKHNQVIIDSDKKYINASPINILGRNYFISTQGPKDNTIEDFWTMIDQYKCNIIIMLCKLEELGRPKCAFYWNTQNKMKKYKIIVSSENKKEIKNDNYIIERKIKLINNNTNEEKEVIQLHYEGWPDHGVPDINKTFEVFEYIIKEVDNLRGKTPAVVHCSAGVGRTGTFISLYYLFKEITEQINNNKLQDIKFSIFNIVRKLKEMRLFMVQTVEQYKFIYSFVYILLQKYNKK